MSNTQFKDAMLHAEKLVRDENLALPIDLMLLAKNYDISVEAKPESNKGVSGMLLRAGEHFAIGYATHIKSIGFQRFSISHELGHYFLPGHPEHIFRGGRTIHESHAGFRSDDHIELEADHFAAGLLMPSHLFKVEADKYSDGFTAIKKLSDQCQSSLTASAIRYAELTEAAIAVIISSGSFVDYCFSSYTLSKIRGYKHPLKGSMLPRDSLTQTFNNTKSHNSRTQQEDDEADLITWFHSDDEITASEQVIALGGYNKTLTIICADLPDEDEEVDDMISTPPRFR